jgi:hypothetical protein
MNDETTYLENQAKNGGWTRKNGQFAAIMRKNYAGQMDPDEQGAKEATYLLRYGSALPGVSEVYPDIVVQVPLWRAIEMQYLREGRIVLTRKKLRGILTARLLNREKRHVSQRLKPTVCLLKHENAELLNPTTPRDALLSSKDRSLLRTRRWIKSSTF